MESAQESKSNNKLVMAVGAILLTAMVGFVVNGMSTKQDIDTTNIAQIQPMLTRLDALAASHQNLNSSTRQFQVDMLREIGKIPANEANITSNSNSIKEKEKQISELLKSLSETLDREAIAAQLNSVDTRFKALEEQVGRRFEREVSKHYDEVVTFLKETITVLRDDYDHQRDLMLRHIQSPRPEHGHSRGHQ